MTSAPSAKLSERFELLEAIRFAFASKKRPAHYTAVLPVAITSFEEQRTDDAFEGRAHPVSRRIRRARVLTETLWSYGDIEEGEVMEASDGDESEGESDGGEEE